MAAEDSQDEEPLVGSDDDEEALTIDTSAAGDSVPGPPELPPGFARSRGRGRGRGRGGTTPPPQGTGRKATLQGRQTMQ